MADNNWCVTSSKEAGESLIGTAVEATRWLLVEHNQPWGAKALPESDLPERVRAYLNALPGTRVQFIKRDDNDNTSFRIFVGDANDIQPRLFTATISDYEALLKLDIDAVMAGKTEFLPHSDPVYLVCCNGKRDLCCAKFGLALYIELSQKLGDAVWQTTHLGGHRFAPTALILPEGLAYGWIDARADEVIDAYQRGEILVDLYRGRVSYPRAAQAAETFLRQTTKNLNIDAYQLTGVESRSNNIWDVTFQQTSNLTEHIVYLRQYMSEFAVYKSSGDPEPASVPQFEQI
jgi:hypothetical protein